MIDDYAKAFTMFRDECMKTIEEGTTPFFMRQSHEGHYYCGAMDSHIAKQFTDCGHNCPYMNIESTVIARVKKDEPMSITEERPGCDFLLMQEQGKTNSKGTQRQ